LSTDSTPSARDRAFAAGESIGESLAREHTHAADQIFEVFAGGALVAPVSHSEMLRVMWGSYLGWLVAHTARVIGTDATTMLQRLMAMQAEEERSRAN
jgi:hypothetical protein